jgi:MFS family permease
LNLVIHIRSVSSVMKSSQRGGAIIQRKSSTPHYHTFDTPPPRSRGKPPSASSNSSTVGASTPGDENGHQESPLPKRQMAILAIIALCEQTAMNSISPYLPKMAASFPEVDESQIGVYVGTIASSYALAQFFTNFFWGWLSDRIGRKPVILTGTLLTAACFVAFGFCKTLWQAILVQTLMGLVNGNQAVVSTCLGEITDRSNQSKAFVYLPVIYGLGGITGPIVGGLLVFQRSPFDHSKPNPHPYLAPNLASAAVLIVDLFLTMMFLEESLEEARHLPPLGKRVKSLFAWMWQFTGSSTRPTYLRNTSKQGAHGGLLASSPIIEEDGEISDRDDEHSADISLPAFLPHHSGNELSSKAVFNLDTILLLVTYLIFQLSNISYNSLYPIFASAPAPTGRDLSTEEIGLSLAFAGVVTILFQVGVFGKLRDKMGNRYTYRAGLAGFAIAFLLMPWVGYKKIRNDDGSISSGRIWLWVELGPVLLLKTVAAVGGLTSALLLVSVSDWASIFLPPCC